LRYFLVILYALKAERTGLYDKMYLE